MGNQFHREQLNKDREAFNQWRNDHPERLDLTGINLHNRDLSRWDFSNCDFATSKLIECDLTGTSFDGSSLIDCDLSRSDMSGASCIGAKISMRGIYSATLENVNLEAAELHGGDGDPMATFSRCKMIACRLRGHDFRRHRFENCDLTHAQCANANFEGASFQHSICDRIGFDASKLVDTNCVDASFVRARFANADLSGADINGANFLEAFIGGTTLRAVKNAYRAKNLDKTLVPGDADSQPAFFNTVERRGFDEWCDWEAIRSIGRMQLFGASYLLLIYLITWFYAVGQYNDHVAVVRAWAESKVDEGSVATRKLGEQVERLKPLKIAKSSMFLLVGTLLLVVASVIFTLRCPAAVKNFSSVEWQYAYGRPLVHYWPLSWSRPRWRGACLVFYIAGVALALPATIWKLVAAIAYGWQFMA